MDAYRLRLAQLALENLPFARHQTRTVLDLHAADGATTQHLQHFLPYSTVFGLTTGSPRRDLAACGQRYLATLPNSFQCDCIVAIVEPSQPMEPTLEAIRGVGARWELIPIARAEFTIPPSFRFPPLREGNREGRAYSVPPACRGNLKEGVINCCFL